MKKTIALLLIAVFVVSLVPLVFADGANDTGLGRNKTNKEAREAERESNKQEREAERESQKQRVETLRTEAKAFMEKRKAEREDRENVLKSAKEAKASGNRNETIAKSKEYLSKTVDQWINDLNYVKAKIQESTELTDQQKSDITSIIDDKVADLTAFKAKIDGATTKDEIKQLAKELKDKKVEGLRMLFNLRVLSARIQGHVNRAKNLEARLEKISERAKAHGVDITAEVASFKVKIAAANDKNTQATGKIAEALTLSKTAGYNDKAKGLMEEARNLLKDAEKSLKDAQDVLKSIVSKIKASGKPDILEATQ